MPATTFDVWLVALDLITRSRSARIPATLRQLSAPVYKLACLAVGALFAWLGYRLFMAGIWGLAGNLHANFKDWDADT